MYITGCRAHFCHLAGLGQVSHSPRRTSGGAGSLDWGPVWLGSQSTCHLWCPRASYSPLMPTTSLLAPMPPDATLHPLLSPMHPNVPYTPCWPQMPPEPLHPLPPPDAPQCPYTPCQPAIPLHPCQPPDAPDTPCWPLMPSETPYTLPTICPYTPCQLPIPHTPEQES